MRNLQALLTKGIPLEQTIHGLLQCWKRWRITKFLLKIREVLLCTHTPPESELSDDAPHELRIAHNWLPIPIQWSCRKNPTIFQRAGEAHKPSNLQGTPTRMMKHTLHSWRNCGGLGTQNLRVGHRSNQCWTGTLFWHGYQYGYRYWYGRPAMAGIGIA